MPALENKRDLIRKIATMKDIKWSQTALSAFALCMAVSLCGQPTAYEVISLPSKPNLPGMGWEGGERTQISQWDGLPTVSNVSEPSLTAYLPEASRANGTALIIAPGGGFHTLSIDNEGRHVAAWCVENGIAAFVLRYRLVPTGENPGQEFMAKLQGGREEMDRAMAPYIDLAKADGLAAIGYVRAHAADYGIKPDRVGIIGFSAGGTLAGAAALEYTGAADRPDFAAPIYGAMHVLDLQSVPASPMPVFLTVTGDDFFGFQAQSIAFFQVWNAAKLPVELHLYEQGGHGFGMRKQSLPSDAWIDAFQAWLGSHGFLDP